MRRAVAALVLVVLATGCSGDGGGASPDGDAFDRGFSGITTSQPVKAGDSFAVFGSALLRNVTGEPITLVDAVPVWSEHVTVSNIGVSPYGPTVPISDLDHPVVGAAEVDGFVVPPSHGENDELYGITIEVRLEPGAEAGMVVGLDVRYRRGDRTAVQRFAMANLVCPWIGEAGRPCPSTYEGIDYTRVPPHRLLEQLLSS